MSSFSKAIIFATIISTFFSILLVFFFFPNFLKPVTDGQQAPEAVLLIFAFPFWEAVE